MLNVSCRGAVDNALTLHVNSLEFDSRRRVLKTYFHCLTDLNYTGRLIASSLSAFNMINPRVSHRHPFDFHVQSNPDFSNNHWFKLLGGLEKLGVKLHYSLQWWRKVWFGSNYHEGWKKVFRVIASLHTRESTIENTSTFAGCEKLGFYCM